MKKVCFVFALLFILSTSQAQIIRGFGLKVGTTISNQDWKYSNSSGLSGLSFDSDSRVGINLGIFTEFLNVPFIGIVTEVNYIQKGMKKEVPVTTISQPDGTGEFVTWNTRVDYINISAYGKLRINAGLFTPYILVGPKIDFEINKTNSLGPVNVVEDNFNKNRFGLKVGLGTEINLLSFKLLAEFLYDADFKELYENENLKVNSNSFDLRVGIIL
ncbi:MAG: PorT family protein [Melioribacteraceae bacterium]|nr:PorT family protein [Melioribacteraceae bacterium]MCZ7604084.1 PorT family protein [Melioribacteraceae bacterium]